MTEIHIPRDLDFTLVFSKNELWVSALAYNLLWVPTPAWHKTGDTQWCVNPFESEIHNGPEYRLGYLKPLLDSEGLNVKNGSNVFICVNKYESESPLERGSENDLEIIIEDLQNNGFETMVCRFD